MKQRISAEDLAELTPEQRERLREWWRPEAGDYIVHDTQGIGCLFGDVDIMDKTHMLPRLSIGQCIELLKDKDIATLQKVMRIMLAPTFTVNPLPKMECALSDTEALAPIELIDALWQAVKEVL